MALLSEHRGTFSALKLYKVPDESTGAVVVEEQTTEGQGTLTQSSRDRWVQGCRLTFRQVFLPHGYPSSVSQDYMAYQIWDTVQAFASSITGALATEAVMRGVGVGSLEATPLAAAMTWLLKNGSGMIGRIIFAWAKGTALDYDNKKWRLFADVLNDLATFIDLIAPLFPSNIIVFIFCGSSIARSLVGVAGGATRAAITQHQARKNNSADVSAKDGSQETLVNLVSLIVCLMLLPAVSGNFSVVWTLFALFTWIHVFSNYRALRALQLETLNTSRLLIALQQYLTDAQVPSVRDVNIKESLIIGFGIKDIDICGHRIRMGVSLEEALSHFSSFNSKQIRSLIDSSQGKSFLIIPNLDQKVIFVLLSENISPLDIIEAYVRTVVTAYSVANENNMEFNALDSSVDHDWESFRNLIVARGFDISQALLESGDWRAKWKHS